MTTSSTTTLAKTTSSTRSAVVAVTVTIDPVIAKKIENATKGLTHSYSRRLGALSPKQIFVICDYISALSILYIVTGVSVMRSYNYYRY